MTPRRCAAPPWYAVRRLDEAREHGLHQRRVERVRDGQRLDAHAVRQACRGRRTHGGFVDPRPRCRRAPLIPATASTPPIAVIRARTALSGAKTEAMAPPAGRLCIRAPAACDQCGSIVECQHAGAAGGGNSPTEWPSTSAGVHAPRCATRDQRVLEREQRRLGVGRAIEQRRTPSSPTISRQSGRSSSGSMTAAQRCKRRGTPAASRSGSRPMPRY